MFAEKILFCNLMFYKFIFRIFLQKSDYFLLIIFLLSISTVKIKLYLKMKIFIKNFFSYKVFCHIFVVCVLYLFAIS